MATLDLAQIQLRRDTAANWTLANPILGAGEFGFETDTHLLKIGDGTTAWNTLTYQSEQLAAQIHLATSKATPVGADEIPLADSAASFGLKKLTWTNLKATIPYFGLFAKADPYSTAFKTTGLGTAQIKAETYVDVNGTLITFAVDTTITMPALTAGTNYFIYVSTAGVIQAVGASGTWPTPVASPPAASRLIGGFHYAPGSNAPAQAGGDTTAQINAYSFWDLKWKPAALDPRGMTLVNNQFWADIYILCDNPQVNGTSSYNQPIADGATASVTTAIIPTAFGGNGTARYAAQDWWSTAECLQAFQKRLPKYAEFQALAYGTTENTSQGTDPVNTIGSGGRNAYTSKWGIILASGNMDVWGADFGGPYAAAGWVNNNGGRGQTYDLPNAVLFGGVWSDGVNSGSRYSSWNNAPANSNSVIGGRGVCDHLALV